MTSDLEKFRPWWMARDKCDTLAHVAHPLALGVTGWRFPSWGTRQGEMASTGGFAVAPEQSGLPLDHHQKVVMRVVVSNFHLMVACASCD